MRFGSKFVNGSVRPLIKRFCKPREYIGVDIEPGKYVYVVLPAERLVDYFGSESFDVVVSTEVGLLPLNSILMSTLKCLKILRLNNLESIIIPINTGLASKSDKICIENVNVDTTIGTYHRPGDCPNAIPAVTLSELISRFGIDPNDVVLKMDCEGCEFDVVLNDYEHVRLFRKLILEYHVGAANRPLDDLLIALSRDYKCEVRRGKNTGIMHCIRR